MFFLIACVQENHSKLLRPVLSNPKNQGRVSVAYLDDTWLSADDYNSCFNNLVETLFVIDILGFVVNLGKSVLIPTRSP